MRHEMQLGISETNELRKWLVSDCSILQPMLHLQGLPYAFFYLKDAKALKKLLGKPLDKPTKSVWNYMMDQKLISENKK
jgi:hypothetical protein